MNNKNTSKNKIFNSKYTTLTSLKIYIIIFMIVIVATGPISSPNLAVVNIASAEEQEQEQTSKVKENMESVTMQYNKIITKDNKKEVFQSLTSIPSLSEDNAFPSSSSNNNKISNNTIHNIEMKVISLPTGQPAYKMISHFKSNGASLSGLNNNNSNSNTIDLTPKYSKLAT